MNDSQAIAEACMTEEQTQRNNGVNTSMDRLGALMERSLEEPTVRTTNNYMTDGSRGELLKLNHLRPSNSTGGGTQPIGTFTDIQNNRQTTDLKKRINQMANNQASSHDVAHRQKIFEEEIIKRIKEI